MKVLIIGSGPAGIVAAESLRAADPTVDLEMVTREPYPPYSPPAMADHFLTGRDEPLFWRGLRRRGSPGHRLPQPRRSVTGARHRGARGRAGGRRPTRRTTRCSIASGSRLHAPIDGRRAARRPRLQVAHGREVDHRSCPARRGEERAHRRRGLHRHRDRAAARRPRRPRHDRRAPRLGHAAHARPGDGRDRRAGDDRARRRAAARRRGDRVRRRDGAPTASGWPTAGVLRADLYVAATGVKPNIAVLEGSGIARGLGRHGRRPTADAVANVWAAGDVVEAPDRVTGETFVHAIFPNAVEQARGGRAEHPGRRRRLRRRGEHEQPQAPRPADHGRRGDATAPTSCAGVGATSCARSSSTTAGSSASASSATFGGGGNSAVADAARRGRPPVRDAARDSGLRCRRCRPARDDALIRDPPRR